MTLTGQRGKQLMLRGLPSEGDIPCWSNLRKASVGRKRTGGEIGLKKETESYH